MPSFDIVSEINLQEVDNAVNQARKEAESRYDFKGVQFEILWDKKNFSIKANDEQKLTALKDIVQSKLHKRGIDLKALQFEKVELMGGMMRKQEIKLIQGIDKEASKEITKKIRDSKLKVQSQIEGEKIKVSSKSRDELQSTMQLLKQSQFKTPLQFNNFRD